MKLLIAIHFIFLPMMLLAGNYNATSKAKHQNFIQQLEKGKMFTNKHEAYTWLPSLISMKNGFGSAVFKHKMAVKSNQKAQSSQPQVNGIQQNSVSIDINPIGTKGKFGIFTKQDAPMVQQKISSNRADSRSKVSVKSNTFPVVVNQRTNQFAIVLGTINVKVYQSDIVEEIADDFDLNIKKQFKHLRRVIFNVEDINAILDICTKLRKDNRVQSAELELLEHISSVE